MNKEKAELYAKLYARAFLITETIENNLREDRHYYWNSENKWEELFCFASELLDKVQEQAEKDLTKEELEYYNQETESPNRYDYE